MNDVTPPVKERESRKPKKGKIYADTQINEPLKTDAVTPVKERECRKSTKGKSYVDNNEPLKMGGLTPVKVKVSRKPTQGKTSYRSQRWANRTRYLQDNRQSTTISTEMLSYLRKGRCISSKTISCYHCHVSFKAGHLKRHLFQYCKGISNDQKLKYKLMKTGQVIVSEEMLEIVQGNSYSKVLTQCLHCDCMLQVRRIKQHIYKYCKNITDNLRMEYKKLWTRSLDKKDKTKKRESSDRTIKNKVVTDARDIISVDEIDEEGSKEAGQIYDGKTAADLDTSEEIHVSENNEQIISDLPDTNAIHCTDVQEKDADMIDIESTTEFSVTSVAPKRIKRSTVTQTLPLSTTVHSNEHRSEKCEKVSDKEHNVCKRYNTQKRGRRFTHRVPTKRVAAKYSLGNILGNPEKTDGNKNIVKSVETSLTTVSEETKTSDDAYNQLDGRQEMVGKQTLQIPVKFLEPGNLDKKEDENCNRIESEETSSLSTLAQVCEETETRPGADNQSDSEKKIVGEEIFQTSSKAIEVQPNLNQRSGNTDEERTHTLLVIPPGQKREKLTEDDVSTFDTKDDAPVPKVDRHEVHLLNEDKMAVIEGTVNSVNSAEENVNKSKQDLSDDDSMKIDEIKVHGAQSTKNEPSSLDDQQQDDSVIYVDTVKRKAQDQNLLNERMHTKRPRRLLAKAIDRNRNAKTINRKGTSLSADYPSKCAYVLRPRGKDDKKAQIKDLKHQGSKSVQPISKPLSSSSPSQSLSAIQQTYDQSTSRLGSSAEHNQLVTNQQQISAQHTHQINVQQQIGHQMNAQPGLVQLPITNPVINNVDMNPYKLYSRIQPNMMIPQPLYGGATNVQPSLIKVPKNTKVIVLPYGSRISPAHTTSHATTSMPGVVMHIPILDANTFIQPPLQQKLPASSATSMNMSENGFQNQNDIKYPTVPCTGDWSNSSAVTSSVLGQPTELAQSLSIPWTGNGLNSSAVTSSALGQPTQLTQSFSIPWAGDGLNSIAVTSSALGQPTQ
ncbi:unnamed protein product, partial [Owenia fusiformis]